MAKDVTATTERPEMRINLVLPFALCTVGVTGFADEVPVIPPVTYVTDMSFEDVSFAVENAIVGAGLVVEGTHLVGQMLARTKEDVGGTKDIFVDSITYNFCSAKVSRQVMEIDPANLQYCPYGIFVYQTVDKPDEVVVGHRAYGGDVAVIGELMESIVKDALMLE